MAILIKLSAGVPLPPNQEVYFELGPFSGLHKSPIVNQRFPLDKGGHFGEKHPSDVRLTTRNASIYIGPVFPTVVGPVSAIENQILFSWFSTFWFNADPLLVVFRRAGSGCQREGKTDDDFDSRSDGGNNSNSKQQQ